MILFTASQARLEIPDSSISHVGNVISMITTLRQGREHVGLFFHRGLAAVLNNSGGLHEMGFVVTPKWRGVNG